MQLWSSYSFAFFFGRKTERQKDRQTDRHSFLAYANLLRSLSDKQKKNEKHRDIEERRKVDRQTEALTY